VNVKRTFRKLSAEALLSSVMKELKQPVKSKSVRVEEAKRATKGPNASSFSGPLKRVLRGLMTQNFQLRDLVYNRRTKEDGLIRRVYEANGAAMYEVAVPQQGNSWSAGYYISDWAEDVLQLSSNGRLKSSTFTCANRL
jgi:hypothetical protein